ncbi:MAG: hypothetical protein C5B49_13260, partial [Bdellovibrio sp.]
STEENLINQRNPSDFFNFLWESPAQSNILDFTLPGHFLSNLYIWLFILFSLFVYSSFSFLF